MKLLGLWPGIGLVTANMIGAGVFLSTGFMAQDMGPGTILAAWAVGALLALAGAQAYAAVAQLVPRSGGEYRYLSELLHPSVGYLAGWCSLLVGFSAPVAVDALASGSFVHALLPSVDPAPVAIAVIVLMTASHGTGLKASAWTQNALAALKGILIVGFAAVGVVAGRHAWPSWHPPGAGAAFPFAAFASSLFYIAFAFSGWNAAAYVSEEFDDPRKNVPRAMLWGCAGVAVLYWIVNWVFVVNLTPAQATAVFTYETQRVTLGHLIAQGLLGPAGASVMSAVIIALLVSAVSAMTFAGPRVYAAMARDGFLPSVFAGQPGKPPVASVLLQSGLAIAIVCTHRLEQALANVGAILSLFAALTVLSLFKVRFFRADLPRPSGLSLVAAGLYASLTAWMLYFGFRGSTHLLTWIAAIGLVALVAYGASRAIKRS